MGCKGRDTKQPMKRGMSKCQKEEVTQRGKRKVFVYKRRQRMAGCIEAELSIEEF